MLPSAAGVRRSAVLDRDSVDAAGHRAAWRESAGSRGRSSTAGRRISRRLTADASRSPRPITPRASSPAAMPAFPRFDAVRRLLDVLLRRGQLRRDGQRRLVHAERRRAGSCARPIRRSRAALRDLSPAASRARRRLADRRRRRRSSRSNIAGLCDPAKTNWYRSISTTRSAPRAKLGLTPSRCASAVRVGSVACSALVAVARCVLSAGLRLLVHCATRSATPVADAQPGVSSGRGRDDARPVPRATAR